MVDFRLCKWSYVASSATTTTTTTSVATEAAIAPQQLEDKN